MCSKGRLMVNVMHTLRVSECFVWNIFVQVMLMFFANIAQYSREVGNLDAVVI